MSTRRNNPDPVGLAIAREMQELLRPTKVILQGSRATGDHRQDSDVDLMAVCLDEKVVREADETLRQLPQGKYDIPVVNVITITEEEFRRTAPLAQSQAGQAARHGVTPDGRSLDYTPEREPEPEEIREATIFWLVMAEVHLDAFARVFEHEWLAKTHIPAFEGQTALERAIKGLLTANNDGARFRMDAARTWRHIESANPMGDRNGAQSVEALLNATRGPDGHGCTLTRLTAWRRGDIVPDPTEQEQQAIGVQELRRVLRALHQAADAAAGVAQLLYGFALCGFHLIFGLVMFALVACFRRSAGRYHPVAPSPHAYPRRVV